MAQLNGKVAIVTGAARGIGEAVAQMMVAEGAQVLLTDMLAEKGKATADKLGSNARFMKHDVSQESDWHSVVSEAERLFGRIDILVNNAGIGGVNFNTLEKFPLADIRKMVDVNFIGVIMGMQSVIPAMRRAGGGSIVNISSANGMMSANAVSVYGATKWAVRGLTKSAALELGEDGIRVNSIHPGGADTAMGNVAGVSREEFSKNFQNVPLRRACDPTEIAEGVLFFASDRGRYCTGAELAIDGGMTAGLYFSGLPGSPGYQD